MTDPMEATQAFLRGIPGDEVLIECMIASGKLPPMPEHLPRILSRITVSASGPDDTAPFLAETEALGITPNIFVGETQAWLDAVSTLRKECSGPIGAVTQLALSDDERLAVVKMAKLCPDTDAEKALADALREQGITPLIPLLGHPAPRFGDDGILAWDSALAAHLDALGAAKSAEQVRDAATKRREQWDKDHQAAGLWKVWTPKGYALRLAQALWPSVKARLAQAPKGNVLMSRDLSKSLAQARFKGGEKEPIVAGEKVDQTIRVLPPNGLTLWLPLDSGTVIKGDEGTVSLRQCLDASALHTLLASMQIFVDSGREGAGGRFQLDERQLLDAMGKRRERLVNGKNYISYRADDSKLVQKHLTLFSEIRVNRVGDFRMKGADALLSEIERISTGEAYYRFSELIQLSLTENYYQIPRVAVRELPSDDIPRALGICEIVRAKMAKHLLQKEDIRAPTTAFFEASGVNYHDGQRKDGLKFWDKEASRFIETAEKGGFGAMRLEGKGPASQLVLEPSQVLLEGYASLATTVKSRIQSERQAKLLEKREAAKHKSR